jgi:5-methylcytosine-specific restriction endonuclease McrA
VSSDRTLLLNSSYEPLKVISWQRAVSMLWLGKVELVRSYDTVLRAVTWSVQMPAVVRLTSFVRRHRVRIAFSRRNVFLRDEHRCQYCGSHFPPAELTCDHVVPRSLGGRTSWENVVTACGPCNRRKGNRTPEQAKMLLSRAPDRPRTLPGMISRIDEHSAPEPWRDFLTDLAIAV